MTGRHDTQQLPGDVRGTLVSFVSPRWSCAEEVTDSHLKCSGLPLPPADHFWVGRIVDDPERGGGVVKHWDELQAGHNTERPDLVAQLGIAIEARYSVHWQDGSAPSAMTVEELRGIATSRFSEEVWVDDTIWALQQASAEAVGQCGGRGPAVLPLLIAARVIHPSVRHVTLCMTGYSQLRVPLCVVSTPVQSGWKRFGEWTADPTAFSKAAEKERAWATHPEGSKHAGCTAKPKAAPAGAKPAKPAKVCAPAGAWADCPLMQTAIGCLGCCCS